VFPKTATFEAERQSFYDNEQHLRSRIQSLTQIRKQSAPPSPTVLVMPETDAEEEEEEEAVEPSVLTQEKEVPHAEPAEMTALKLELSTLSTSHASIQNTLGLLQSQLVDLKRVNNQLQEENESYNILLREKTLSGQYDLFRRVRDSPTFGDDDGQTDDMGDVRSVQSGAHSTQLGTVDEHPDEDHLHIDLGTDHDDDLMPNSDDEGSLAREGSTRGKRARHGRNHRGGSHSPPPQGESLAGLPITGPGLDLAAELGRAENKDILEDHSVDVSGPPKDKRGKKGVSESRKVSAAGPGMERPDSSLNEVDTLRNEIKSLKDANKALSLYASKIIDRIIAQEGFEHVLAADYESKSPATPAVTLAPPDTSAGADAKPKRRNTMTARLNSNPSPQVEKLTTFNSPPPPTRSSRRSLSFDWRALSSFVGGDKDKKPEANPNLRPLTLKPGRVSGARKLETQEDEEDRKERERLDATMKLMGIEKPPSVPPPSQEFYTTSDASTPTVESVASPPLSSRFSFFRRSTAPSESTPNPSAESLQGTPINLTHDTLVQSQAEESLAALDAQERILGAEMAKGGNGGFTEILARRKSGSRRSHTSGGGSGSTVWSAGMSRAGEDED
jgi:hypothetical protein